MTDASDKAQRASQFERNLTSYNSRKELACAEMATNRRDLPLGVRDDDLVPSTSSTVPRGGKRIAANLMTRLELQRKSNSSTNTPGLGKP